MSISPYALPGIEIKISVRDAIRNNIATATARHFGTTHEQLMSRCRKRELVFPRQVAMLLMYECGYTQNECANHFKLNHATANHARNTIEGIIKYDKKLDNEVRQLANNLGVKIKFERKHTW